MSGAVGGGFAVVGEWCRYGRGRVRSSGAGRAGGCEYFDGSRLDFEVNDGEVKAYYNGTQVATLEADFDGGYFKAGAYTHANCEKSSPCNASNYGEAVLYNITVNHS